MSDSSDNRGVRSSLSSITSGAALFFVGRLLSNGLKFLLNFLLTRGLGSSLYGVYTYATTLFTFATIFARLGTGKSLLRYIPAYEDDYPHRDRIVGLAYLTALIGSVLGGIGLYLLAPFISALTLDTKLLVDTLRVLAIALPFNTIINLTNSVFRGLEKLEYQVIIADVVQPISQILVVGVALVLGYSLLGVVAALAIGTILVCLVSVTLLYDRTPLRPIVSSQQPQSEVTEFYNYSIPLTLKDVGSVLYNRVDILMVGFFLAEAAVGIYQISILITTLLALPLTAVNQLFPTVASELYENENIEELKSVYETITRWTLTAAIPPALVISLYSDELLTIFGSDFVAGAPVLILFTIGQVTNCAVGPSGFLLMMTDHQYLNLTNQWLLGALNVIFNYVLILKFGLVGAALATATVLTFINIIRVIEVWYTERMTPYSWAFWKPLVAGMIAGIVMCTLSRFLSGYPLLVSGSLIGGVVFLCLLVIFGIEDNERELFIEIIRPE